MDFEKASSSDNIKSMIKAIYVWCDDFLLAKYRIRMTGMEREIRKILKIMKKTCDFFLLIYSKSNQQEDRIQNYSNFYLLKFLAAPFPCFWFFGTWAFGAAFFKAAEAFFFLSAASFFFCLAAAMAASLWAFLTSGLTVFLA